MSQLGKVLVTGANGFIGRAAMERFRSMGAEVIGVDLQADAARNVHAADVSMPGAWQALARGCDLLLHTVAVVSNNAPAALYRRVSLGTVNQVVDAAADGRVGRIIHLSSIAAYGLDFDARQSEDSPICLLSGYPYCEAKAASEHALLAAQASGRASCTIIRPGDVYGPGSRPWVLLPLEMMRKRQFLLPAHGLGIFSPVYIDNLLDGICAAAQREEAAGHTFNITDGTDVSCLEFFSYHRRWLGLSGAPPAMSSTLATAITCLGAWIMNGLLRQKTEISMGSLVMLKRQAGYSIEKARQFLDYRPAVKLDQGMSLVENRLREEGLIQ